MKLYDAHCHLNEEHLFLRWEECLKRFVDAGGAGIVNVGASEEYNRNGIVIANANKNSQVFVKATIGLHPESIETGITKENIQQHIKNLKIMIEENREYVVAVGECGIDLHFPGALGLLELQKELFALQCELARELNLPLVIHSRDAFDQTLDVLKNYTDMVIYFHCRGYGPNEVERLKVESQKSNRTLFIGFCGNLTYKKAETLRESLKLVPLEVLLLETDAPYLSPQAVRGEKNEPANVLYIYQEAAKVLNQDISALAEQVEHNFKTLYIK